MRVGLLHPRRHPDIVGLICASFLPVLSREGGLEFEGKVGQWDECYMGLPGWLADNKHNFIYYQWPAF